MNVRQIQMELDMLISQTPFGELRAILGDAYFLIEKAVTLSDIQAEEAEASGPAPDMLTGI